MVLRKYSQSANYYLWEHSQRAYLYLWDWHHCLPSLPAFSDSLVRVACLCALSLIITGTSPSSKFNKREKLIHGIIWKSLLDTRSLSFSDIYLDFIKSPLTLSTPTNKDRLSGSSPTNKDKLSGSTPANNNKHSGSTSSCDYILSGSYIFPQFVSKNLVGSPLVIDMVVQR